MASVVAVCASKLHYQISFHFVVGCCSLMLIRRQTHSVLCRNSYSSTHGIVLLLAHVLLLLLLLLCCACVFMWQVVMAYTVGIAAALLSFQHIPAGAAALQWLNVFMIGFFLYGPQMLIGLCGAELVGPDSVGASEGFLGWIAYLGEGQGGLTD